MITFFSRDQQTESLPLVELLLFQRGVQRTEPLSLSQEARVAIAKLPRNKKTGKL